MAKGDKKRTYKLTDDAVSIVDWMEDNTILDKSDFTDRAIKYYWAQYKKGNLNDPILTDNESGGGDVPDLSGEEEGSSSFFDRLRGKRE